jgi:hypothetical protein
MSKHPIGAAAPHMRTSRKPERFHNAEAGTFQATSPLSHSACIWAEHGAVDWACPRSSARNYFLISQSIGRVVYCLARKSSSANIKPSAAIVLRRTQ